MNLQDQAAAKRQQFYDVLKACEELPIDERRAIQEIFYDTLQLTSQDAIERVTKSMLSRFDGGLRNRAVFEYRVTIQQVEELNYPVSIQHYLNKNGEDGWELVHHFTNYDRDMMKCYFIFKRPRL